MLLPSSARCGHATPQPRPRHAIPVCPCIIIFVAEYFVYFIPKMTYNAEKKNCCCPQVHMRPSHAPSTPHPRPRHATRVCPCIIKYLTGVKLHPQVLINSSYVNPLRYWVLGFRPLLYIKSFSNSFVMVLLFLV